LNKTRDQKPRLLQGLSIISSIIITGVNYFLRVVIRKFSLYEKHDTLTNHHISVALKLSYARFLNTAIVPIIINYSFNSWIEEGGLVSDIFYLMLSIAFLDPFLNLINIPLLIKKLKRWRERNLG
jgi:hypothetical protein